MLFTLGDVCTGHKNGEEYPDFPGAGVWEQDNHYSGAPPIYHHTRPPNPGDEGGRSRGEGHVSMVGMGREKEREREITKHIKEGESHKEVDVRRGKKRKRDKKRVINVSDFMRI